MKAGLGTRLLGPGPDIFTHFPTPECRVQHQSQVAADGRVVEGHVTGSVAQQAWVCGWKWGWVAEASFGGGKRGGVHCC